MWRRPRGPTTWRRAPSRSPAPKWTVLRVSWRTSSPRSSMIWGHIQMPLQWLSDQGRQHHLSFLLRPRQWGLCKVLEGDGQRPEGDAFKFIPSTLQCVDQAFNLLTTVYSDPKRILYNRKDPPLTICAIYLTVPSSIYPAGPVLQPTRLMLHPTGPTLHPVGSPPPPHPKVLSMKECSSEKVLMVRKSQNDSLDQPSPKDWPGGQQEQGHGVVLDDPEEGYQQHIIFRFARTSSK